MKHYSIKIEFDYDNTKNHLGIPIGSSKEDQVKAFAGRTIPVMEKLYDHPEGQQVLEAMLEDFQSGRMTPEDFAFLIVSGYAYAAETIESMWIKEDDLND